MAYKKRKSSWLVVQRTPNWERGIIGSLSILGKYAVAVAVVAAVVVVVADFFGHVQTQFWLMIFSSKVGSDWEHKSFRDWKVCGSKWCTCWRLNFSASIHSPWIIAWRRMKESHFSALDSAHANSSTFVVPSIVCFGEVKRPSNWPRSVRFQRFPNGDYLRILKYSPNLF